MSEAGFDHTTAETDPPHRRFATATRLGFISAVEPLEPGALSGMPWRMRQALTARGADVVTLLPGPRGPRSGRVLGAIERRVPPVSRRRRLAAARRQSHTIDRAIRAQPLDVLMGVCISRQLCAITAPSPPIVYFSDATARLIYETYPEHRRAGLGAWRAADELEKIAIQRSAAAVFASAAALRSAVDDYGLDPARGFVVPMGANVVPEPWRVVDPQPPDDRELRLCIIAANPARKRLHLAIEATEQLGAMGWNATLTYIGPHDPRADASPVVDWVGRLRLADADDHRRQCDILADSHVMLLPSTGEAFGIVCCEAAHFGRPSVVSDTGGTRTAVIDGQTGLVMPSDARAAEYAEAIDALVSEPDSYRAMCLAALQRARAELTWDAWADRMVAIIERVS